MGQTIDDSFRDDECLFLREFFTLFCQIIKISSVTKFCDNYVFFVILLMFFEFEKIFMIERFEESNLIVNEKLSDGFAVKSVINDF